MLSKQQSFAEFFGVFFFLNFYEADSWCATVRTSILC